MHSHRSAPCGVARPGTVEFEAQRLLLLELLVDPPPGGDPLGRLAQTLRLGMRDLRAAAVTLERSGLAQMRDERLEPSPTARAFDALWPIAL